nr:hypothetical protein [uncultured Rhodopila sp.]
MSTTAAAPSLSTTYSDLTLAPGTPQSALDTARHALAIAAVTGQAAPLSIRPSIAAAPPPPAATLPAFDQLVTQSAAARPAAQTVIRRDFTTRLSPDPRVTVVPAGGQAVASTLGPFLDAFGRPVLIDTFAVATLIGIERTGATQPFLFIEAPPGSGQSASLTLGAGSVWISAPLLAPGSPAGSFVGLRIKSGTVAFGSSVAVSVSPIVVPATATLSLTLTLDPATPPGGSGPGGDARAAAAVTPATVTFDLSPTAGTLTAAGNASITAFGTTIALTRNASAAHFDPVFGRVDFPFAATPATFAVASRHSTLATFAGAAPIFGAAWSLPISTSAPATLGTAAGAGGCALGLSPGLTVTWNGPPAPVACGACVLLVEPGLLSVGGLTAQAPGFTQLLPLWSSTTLALTTPSAFAFRFVSDATGTESWAFLPQLVATFDVPRTVNDVRIANAALVVLIQTAANLSLFVECAAPQSQRASIQSYCLKNLLLNASNPLVLIAATVLTGPGAGGGTAALQFALRFVLPILPDPYATNLLFEPARRGDVTSIGAVTVLVGWQPAKPPVINLILPADALGGVAAAPPSAAPTAPPAADADALGRLQSLFDSAAGGHVSGPTLLDVSTNVSQFGVTFNTAAHIDATVAAPAATAPSIADLFLQAPGSELRVVTLPAVQWEPVITPDQTTPFPSPLSFPNSGQPTTLGAKTVTLVPVAPRQAIDALLAAYNTGAAEVGARFTLPFGIAAVAQLQASADKLIPAPRIAEVQPKFTAAGLAGGDQISISAARPLLLSKYTRSPALPGAAFQLHNALAAGAPTNTTVLTPIDDTFNGNFSPGGTNPGVPVTRIDISGFGESLFSNWRNPTDAAAIISKAQFDVVVGRTAREIVQAYSVLYPYAVRVVRTITIERQNGAAVVRHDSGWQAVSDGLYAYPDPPSKPVLVTHPGVVRSAVSVQNIRDTGQRYTTPDGSELMAVRFDCSLTMENAVLGAGPDGVPALDQLGYVQLTDPPGNGQLAPAQYAALLSAAGPLGGLLDCTIDVGGSGLRMRITHVGVAATSSGSGDPQFAIAARGSPILPGGGQWSFLFRPAGAAAPQAVDPDQGVPLVRAGPSTAAPPGTSPYLFADPADLLHPATPDGDYGLVQSTGTQRLLFPRPKIEATGAHAITSTQNPQLADPFALATATGPFPRIAACIPFPNPNYALTIAASGNLTLEPSPFSFTTPVLKRVLRQSATVRSIAYTADENNNPAQVTLSIDTAAASPWSVNITNLSLATESGSLGEVTRVVGNVVSTPAAATQLANSRFVFGPPLKPVAALVNFLEQFGSIPPPNVSMTNDWQLLAGITFDFTKYALFLGPAVAAFVEEFIVDLDVKMQSETKPTTTNFVMQFELTIKIPTPFPPIVAIGLAKVQFQMGDQGSFWTVQIGVGVGVSFQAGPFEAIAYYAQTQFIITGDTVFGLGASSLVKGTVDLKIVEVSLSIEAKIALLKVSCNVSDSAIWAAAQVTIAFEISIFFVIDIEFDEQAEWTQNLDGGACALPDVL